MEASDHPTDTPTTHDETEQELVARVVTADDGTELCTIYPQHVEDAAQTTTWVSAEEGSFVDLTDVR